ncbi:hypothetical protein EHM69_05680 [candidate division KSB1 bacterium]|nr:MAG: hypothetical protein EHM69_05680 [candidate division KSB1 bacterium]
MKRLVLLLVCCIGLALPLWAGTYPLGIGAYSGYDFPVIQDDVGAGMMWGVGVRGNIWHFLHGQIIVRGTSQGDKDEELEFGNNQTETITFKGGTLTGFGLNLLFAKQELGNVWPYALIGFSSNSMGFGDSFKEDESYMGWSVGGGLGINLYQKKIYLDANTSLLVMPFHDNNASRKNWQTLVGLQYFIPIRTK